MKAVLPRDGTEQGSSIHKPDVVMTPGDAARGVLLHEAKLAPDAGMPGQVFIRVEQRACPVGQGRNRLHRFGCAPRAEAAALIRGGDGTLTQADLDCAVTCAGVLPKIDAELRRHFRSVVAQQLALVAEERGLVIGADMSDHVRRSLGRVAARRALQECRLVTIEGREYPQCFSGSVA